MRKNSIFWGGLLVVFGALLLLSNLGLITAPVWSFFWPLALIAGGIWLMIGVIWKPKVENEKAVIPLNGARKARVTIQHGAGRLHVDSGAMAENLLQGDFNGGLSANPVHKDDMIDVTLRPSDIGGWGWGWQEGERDWRVSLNPETALALTFETGAGESWLDLSNLRVNELTLHTGASSTNLTLPANAGLTQVFISTGAASVKVRVPDGVAARIKSQSGLASIKVNQARFPHSGSVYESSDYLTAANKADISIEAGVASIEII